MKEIILLPFQKYLLQDIPARKFYGTLCYQSGGMVKEIFLQSPEDSQFFSFSPKKSFPQGILRIGQFTINFSLLKRNFLLTADFMQGHVTLTCPDFIGSLSKCCAALQPFDEHRVTGKFMQIAKL